MKKQSYEFWQCTKCDEMNSSNLDVCKECGSQKPDIYTEEISKKAEPKSLEELKKAFYSKWITVGDILIFGFVINLIALVIYFIAILQS